MYTKLGRVVTYLEGLPPGMSTKFVRVVTYLEGLPLIKSYGPLIMQDHVTN